MINAFYEDVSALAAELKENAAGKKTVFTNGCFDIIHPGHIYILSEASKHGDILIVGLNSDSSVKRLKGTGRPVMDQSARAQILSALEMVDFVIIFSEDTPIRLIEELKPDVLVKGSQYGEGEVVGEDLVPLTVRVPMKPGYSTSGILGKLQS